jgi:hypothetical protein
MISLTILGRLERELSDKFFRKYALEEKNNCILFCDYSSFDIDRFSKFTRVCKGNRSNIIYEGQITLIKILQEQLLEYDYIPKGHKTLCCFKFHEDQLPKFVFDIPSARGWMINHKQDKIYLTT